MSIELAVWKWNDAVALPSCGEVHEVLATGKPHPAMAAFDTADFEAGLTEMHALAGEPGGPWRFEKRREDDVSWFKVQVELSMVQLFAPRLVTLAVVHGLVVSDPHNDHIIGA